MIDSNPDITSRHFLTLVYCVFILDAVEDRDYLARLELHRLTGLSAPGPARFGRVTTLAEARMAGVNQRGSDTCARLPSSTNDRACQLPAGWDSEDDCERLLAEDSEAPPGLGLCAACEASLRQTLHELRRDTAESDGHP